MESSSKNFKAEILLWLSGAFLCGKPYRGKHLTATEMKQNTIGFSLHKSFSFNCRKLKINSRTRENYFAFGYGFFPQRNWYKNPSVHLKVACCLCNGSGKKTMIARFLLYTDNKTAKALKSSSGSVDGILDLYKAGRVS